MTNSITKFAVVSTKSMVSKAGAAIQFPAQLRMEIANGKTKQVVSFGYSRLGGRMTYLSVQGKAPVAMRRSEFVKMLTAKNIAGASVVIDRLNQLSAVYTKDVTVAACKVCSTGHVTAANMDFIQRNSAALSERLGQEITPFTPVCFSCQGSQPKANSKAPSQQKQAPSKMATPAVAQCACCNKDIHSKRVVTVSRKKYGQVLCYPTCQAAATPVAPAQPVIKVVAEQQADYSSAVSLKAIDARIEEGLSTISVEDAARLAAQMEAIDTGRDVAEKKESYVAVEEEAAALEQYEEFNAILDAAPEEDVFPEVGEDALPESILAITEGAPMDEELLAMAKFEEEQQAYLDIECGVTECPAPLSDAEIADLLAEDLKL